MGSCTLLNALLVLPYPRSGASCDNRALLKLMQILNSLDYFEKYEKMVHMF